VGGLPDKIAVIDMKTLAQTGWIKAANGLLCLALLLSLNLRAILIIRPYGGPGI
jgi:hypothetical protein